MFARFIVPRKRESTLVNQMETRLRGYDILSGRSKNCKDSGNVNQPQFQFIRTTHENGDFGRLALTQKESYFAYLVGWV